MQTTYRIKLDIAGQPANRRLFVRLAIPTKGGGTDITVREVQRGADGQHLTYAVAEAIGALFCGYTTDGSNDERSMRWYDPVPLPATSEPTPVRNTAFGRLYWAGQESLPVKEDCGDTCKQECKSGGSCATTDADAPAVDGGAEEVEDLVPEEQPPAAPEAPSEPSEAEDVSEDAETPAEPCEHECEHEDEADCDDSCEDDDEEVVVLLSIKEFSALTAKQKRAYIATIGQSDYIDERSNKAMIDGYTKYLASLDDDE